MPPCPAGERHSEAPKQPKSLVLQSLNTTEAQGEEGLPRRAGSNQGTLPGSGEMGSLLIPRGGVLPRCLFRVLWVIRERLITGVTPARATVPSRLAFGEGFWVLDLEGGRFMPLAQSCTRTKRDAARFRVGDLLQPRPVVELGFWSFPSPVCSGPSVPASQWDTG